MNLDQFIEHYGITAPSEAQRIWHECNVLREKVRYLLGPLYEIAMELEYA